MADNTIVMASLLIVGLLIGGLGVYFLTGAGNNNTTNCSLSAADKNYIAYVAVATGFCEMRGTQPSLFIQIDKDTNTPYGIPICVAR